MTNFNALPLAEKIKQAQAGDIVVTDSGARLPFILRMGARFMVRATRSDTYYVYCNDVTDIIRPTARKVPEVVGILREASEAIALNAHSHNLIIIRRMFSLLADHFEKGEHP